MNKLPDKKTLKEFVLRGSAWTLGGHGAGLLLRFVRSLILTRLLMPEAFGVMAIVWAVMYALEMFSDIGVGGAIVRDKRGDDPDFLNTAWTMQVLRGVVLWLLTCALAYPMAVFYANPELLKLIPVVGFSALITGFGSTAFFTCARHMEYRKVTLLNLANEVLAYVVVITWAYLSPTVWALVGGALIGRLFMTVASHWYLPGIRNQFRWDASAFTVLFRFGKWVFISSALYVAYAQGDKLILGKFLSLEMLGVYSVAMMLSESVSAVTSKLIHSVFYPAFSRVFQSEPDKLYTVLGKARLGIDAVLVLPIAILMVIGNVLVGLIYDSRYAGAGWMLQVLCVRLLMATTLMVGEVSLFAKGHAHYGAIQNACRVAWLAVGIPVGWAWGGIEGAVWAVALTELPATVVIWIGLRRNGMFSVIRELRSVGFAAAGALAGTGLLWIYYQWV